MEKLNGHSKLLKVFVGEIDKYDHTPFYEAVLYKAREQNMAGGTVMRGILSYGASSLLHTSKLIDISEDLPIIIELIDTEEKIRAFATVVGEMLEKAGCGGIVAISDAEVVNYKPKHGDAGTL